MKKFDSTDSTQDNQSADVDTGIVSMQDQMILQMNAADTTASRLDADFYNVADIDGVAESLFGSGNLNYLTLQSQQTDLANTSVTYGDLGQNEMSIANLGAGLSAGRGISALMTSGVTDGDTDNLADDNIASAFNNDTARSAPTALQQVTSSTAAASASTVESADSALRSITSDSSGNRQTADNGSNGKSGQDGVSGQDGAPGTPGASGTNGLDGQDGGGEGDTLIDIDNSVNVLNNVLNDLSILNNLDILNNLNIEFLNNILNNITINIFNPFGDPQDPNDTDLHVDLGLTGPVDLNPIIDVILDPVEAVVGDIDINILPDIGLNPDGSVDIGLDLDALVANLPLLDTAVDLGIPSLQNVLTDPLGSVDGLLGDVTGIVDSITSSGGMVGDLLGGVLGEGNDDSDTDLHVDLGVDGLVNVNPVLDVVLDPVENLVGDIDINVLPDIGINEDGSMSIDLGLDAVVGDIGIPDVDLSLDVPSVENIVADPVGSVTDLTDNLAGELQDTVESLNEGLLGGVLPDTDIDAVGDLLGGILGEGNDGSDTDLHVDLGTNGLVDVNPVLDVVLDPVENIVGDIDINVLPDIGINEDGSTSLDLGLDAVVGDIGIPDVNLSLDTPSVDNIVADPVGSVTDLADNLAGELQDTVETLNEGLIGGVLPDGGNDVVGDTIDLVDNLLGGDSNDGDDTDLTVLGLEVNLDPVEALTSDIDLDIDNAIDDLTGGGLMPSLGDIAADNPLGNLLGGGEEAWPTSPVNTLVDNVFDSLTGGADGAGDLPLPIGTVAEGLGILNLDGGGSSGGGLLGGGGGGGLFGGLFG